MRKRVLAVVMFLAVIAAGAVLWAHSRAPAGLVLEPGVDSGWPSNQYRCWSFPLPPSGPGVRVGLRFRENSTPLPAPGTLAIGGRLRAMAAPEACRTFGTGMAVLDAPIKGVTSGTVSIQLLDLSAVGVASSKPGQSLRVLADMRVGAMGSSLGKDDIFLPAGRLAGWSTGGAEGRWSNGELYLMSFWVEGDSRLFLYDAFLEQTMDQRAR